MYRLGLVLAVSVICAGCATSQTAAAKKEVCTTEPVESTGSRVETETVCQPAE